MYIWPEQEWRRIIRANPHTGQYDLAIRELADLVRELDNTREEVTYLKRINRVLLESLELERGTRRDQDDDE